jgi:Flp pilus assembly protein TadD
MTSSGCPRSRTRTSGSALSDCNQAIQLDPKNALAYTNRCAAHINKGETDQALSDCNQAILLDPKNAMAFHNRAAWYFAKGDYDRAIGDLDQVLRLVASIVADVNRWSPQCKRRTT